MSFLSKIMHPAKFGMVIILGIAAAPAMGQQTGPSNNPGPSRSAPEGEKSTFNPNCITHVCPPRRPMRKVASRESCECKVNVIRSGGRTIQVKDCYVQLPDNTVHFCKSPFAKGQPG